MTRSVDAWAFGRCAACGFGAPLFWRPTVADMSIEAVLGRSCPACGATGTLSLTLGAGARDASTEWLRAAAGLTVGPDADARRPEPPPGTPSIPVETLDRRVGVSRRLFEGLYALGIRDLAEVGERSAMEFIRLPNFGRKTLNELVELCTLFGVPGPSVAPVVLSRQAPMAGDEAQALLSAVTCDGRSASGDLSPPKPTEVPEILDALDTLVGEVLDERVAQMVRARFGIGVDDPARTLQEVADRHGITRERVRQLVDRSLTRLKAALRSPRTDAARFLAFEIRPRLPGELRALVGSVHDLAGYLPTANPAQTTWCLAYLFGPRVRGFRQMRDLVGAAIREHLRPGRTAGARTAPKTQGGKRRVVERVLANAWWPTSPGRFSAKAPPVSGLRLREVQTGRPGRITGSFTSTRDDYGSISFESGHELTFLKALDSSPRVAWYAEQGVEVRYDDRGTVRRTFPDAIMVADDGRALLVEVKPVIGMFWTSTLRKALAAREFAEAMGWGFALSTGSGLTLAEIAARPIDLAAAEALTSAIDAAGGALRFPEFKPLRDMYRLGPTELGVICIAHDLAVQALPWAIVRVPPEASWRVLLGRALTEARQEAAIDT